MIGILDLNTGNLRSVANSIYETGFDYLLIKEEKQLDDVTHLIIPGVGHFSAAMKALHTHGFTAALNNFYNSKRPMLGLCLGMQLFSTIGEEGGKTEGLNFIPGRVQRFVCTANLRIPHVGWNSVAFQKKHPVLEGIKDSRDFYFVHSYHYQCDQTDNILGTTEYGVLFPSMVSHKQVIGFQFHPEKSQKNGLALLENFCRWDGLC